ncbi:MAG TPA: phosphatidate cytidylyltransferase [Candidatus Fimimonas merdipullorum]|uniref:Phosphatidate cytidylyltransferase n=1 Tax=Candidatus Fimimonas merdipullorum TaxID=2840822 RepID=A0A9D1SPX4_9BACT|nr:phosphatidate cytidylyltransferase [Candidatus Fimimonas merdipullorum]
MLNKKTLANRILVGAGVFILMIGMVLLNVYLPNYKSNPNSLKVVSGRSINAAIISVLSWLAVIEMRRAIGRERIPDSFSWILWMYAIGLGVTYSMFGFMGVIFLSLLVFVAAAITALAENRGDSLIYVAFMLVYPGLFMSALLYLNRCASTFPIAEGNPLLQYLEYDIWQYFGERQGSQLLPYNAISLALVFAVSSFTDVFAFFVGSLFGKRKLCEHISPKKTVEGALGGLLGGAIGSLVVFLLFDYFKIFGEHFGLTYSGLGLSSAAVALTYVTVGIFGSAMTQVGDLLASMVKRYCGIKDYSRILGEHGGIMDRFDGIMVNAVFVSFVFMFII